MKKTDAPSGCGSRHEKRLSWGVRLNRSESQRIATNPVEEEGQAQTIPDQKIGMKKRSERSCLPAVSAIAAATAVATISTTTTTTAAASTAITTTASAATTTAAVPAASTTATGAFRLRPCFVHHQVPAPEILTVQGCHGPIRFFIVVDFNEGETARLTRKAITNQTDCGGINTDLTEPFLELLFRCVERKITDVKLLHQRTPSARNRTAIAERTEKPTPLQGQTGVRAMGAVGTNQWSRAWSRIMWVFATIITCGIGYGVGRASGRPVDRWWPE